MGAVVLGGETELRGVWRGPVQVVVGPQALMHDQLDELRHGWAEAVPLVGVDDVGEHPDRHLTVFEQRDHRWLVGDEGAHVLGVDDHPVQPAHAAAARPERVHRPEPGRLDDAVVILGVHLHRELAAGPTGAPLHAAGVVGDDRAAREVTDELLEAGGAHRRAENEQRAFVARGVGLMDVVRQRGAGDIEGVGGRLGHACSFVRILPIPTGALFGPHRPAGPRDRPLVVHTRRPTPR